MKRVLISLFLLLTIGCSMKEQKISETELKELREGNPGITKACVDKVRWGGIEAFPFAVDECFRMEMPRRWRGLWHTDFEQSLFCPAPAQDCSFDTPGDKIWVSASAKTTGLPREDKSQVGVPVLYAVDFIGRRTTVRGYHGHQAQYPYEVVIDRMIAMKEIEAPPER